MSHLKYQITQVFHIINMVIGSSILVTLFHVYPAFVMNAILPTVNVPTLASIVYTETLINLMSVDAIIPSQQSIATAK